MTDSTLRHFVKGTTGVDLNQAYEKLCAKFPSVDFSDTHFPEIHVAFTNDEKNGFTAISFPISDPLELRALGRFVDLGADTMTPKGLADAWTNLHFGHHYSGQFVYVQHNQRMLLETFIALNAIPESMRETFLEDFDRLGIERELPAGIEIPLASDKAMTLYLADQKLAFEERWNTITTNLMAQTGASSFQEALDILTQQMIDDLREAAKSMREESQEETPEPEKPLPSSALTHESDMTPTSQESVEAVTASSDPINAGPSRIMQIIDAGRRDKIDATTLAARLVDAGANKALFKDRVTPAGDLLNPPRAVLGK